MGVKAMWDNVFKYLNSFAIFVLGLTSSVIVYAFELAYIGFVFGGGAVVSGWSGSWPWNLFAGIGFIFALIYIIWYAHRQVKKDELKAQKNKEDMKQAVKDGIKEAIMELKNEGKL
jgi:type VI protein secretion system component VasK